ncbi:hypothetical protein ARMGADRAFT_608547 [Armillaria gallica]|uniref:Uncharacterized protein n=1 Tax=Armillaria gallica TaxID=47427 RepID=A0A2H3DA94_ARMGA|nr:hypothetical protein ARMGADRAFT_608547 [Armillaria gallica]
MMTISMEISKHAAMVASSRSGRLSVIGRRWPLLLSATKVVVTAVATAATEGMLGGDVVLMPQRRSAQSGALRCPFVQCISRCLLGGKVLRGTSVNTIQSFVVGAFSPHHPRRLFVPVPVPTPINAWKCTYPTELYNLAAEDWIFFVSTRMSRVSLIGIE